MPLFMAQRRPPTRGRAAPPRIPLRVQTRWPWSWTRHDSAFLFAFIYRLLYSVRQADRPASILSLVLILSCPDMIPAPWRTGTETMDSYLYFAQTSPGRLSRFGTEPQPCSCSPPASTTLLSLTTSTQKPPALGSVRLMITAGVPVVA